VQPLRNGWNYTDETLHSCIIGPVLDVQEGG